MSESPIKPIEPKPADNGSPVPPKISPMPFASAPKLNPIVRDAAAKYGASDVPQPASPASPGQPQAVVPPSAPSKPAAPQSPPAPASAAPVAKPQTLAGKTLATNKTIILKRPVIRKPILGAKPPAIKPVAAPAAQPATPAGTITGPIPPTAVLRKTGIIADSSSPELQQAAKSKTSRISLNDAIGIAPTKSPAPLKTIRLKRPSNLPGAPAAPQSPAAPPASEAKTQPAISFKPLSPLKPLAPKPSGNEETKDDKSGSITQKRTLKIQRPVSSFKRPVSLSRPVVKTQPPVSNVKPEENVIPPAPDDGDIPEVSAAVAAPVKIQEAKPVARGIKPVPGWFMAISLITSIAALFVAAFLTYVLGDEGISKEPSANVTGFMQSEEEHLPAMPNLLIKWAQPD